MTLIEAILLAISLCADCFAVSLCSSVTIKKIDWKNVTTVASSFAVIQSGLLLAGWLFGNAFFGLVEKVAHIIGFLLLLYVGGSMLYESIKGEQQSRNLNGMKNVFIGSIATSIDALAVGVSQSMSGQIWKGFAPLLVSVFIVTAISVAAGIWGGKTIGSKVGRWTEVVGGAVLIIIGARILIG